VLQANLRTEKFTVLSVDIDLSARRANRDGITCDLSDCVRLMCAEEVCVPVCM
jgi:hypothetical protein